MKIKHIKYATPMWVFVLAVLAFNKIGIWCWLPVIYGFIVIPAIEFFLAPNEKNLAAAEEEMAKQDKWYDYLLHAIVPLQYASLIMFLVSLKNVEALTQIDIAGRIASMSLLCGIFGINVAHELGHRVNKYEQFLAKALLLTSLYTHFFIEHNKGHHKHVATPEDPSSAPYGQSLYAFWIRTISGTYIKAWKIAAADAAKKGKQPYGLQNEMLQLQLLQIAFVGTVYLVFGIWVMLYFLVAASIGFLLLETVNYIEHYGLRRKITADGKFERTLPEHSWNSNHPLGRLMLFELSRHSDHHYLASRKYQILRHHEQAPQLPTGYPGSMLMATLPPLWFAVMHKRIRNISAAANS